MGAGFRTNSETGIYSHAAAYAACPETELAAICDTDEGKLTQVGEHWNVKACYTDPTEFFVREAPEIVSICTPDETHFNLATVALEAPGTRAILLEKPLAMRLADAWKLVSRASERGIVLAVNYSRRYAASHWALRETLRNGQIGRLQGLSGFYTKGLIHNGTHWLDLARFLCGEIICVQGFAGHDNDSNDPTLSAWLKFDNGATAFLYGCDAEAFSIFEMDIIGTAGRVRILDSGHQFETFVVGEDAHFAGYRSLRPTNGIDGGLRNTTLHAVEDLIDCLNHPGQQPQCSGRDALKALEVAVAVQESATRGKIVRPGGV